MPAFLRRLLLAVVSLGLLSTTIVSFTPSLAQNSVPLEEVARISTGLRVIGVAVNPTTNRIYIPGFTGTTGLNGVIRVVNGNNNSTIGTITLGTSLYKVLVNSNTDHVYVYGASQPGLGGGKKISIYNGTTTQLINSVNVSSGYNDIVLDTEANRLYIADFNAVTVINATTLATITTIPITTSPAKLVLNQRTKRLYVSWFGSRSAPPQVEVINTENNTQERIIEDLYIEAVNPVTRRLYGVRWVSKLLVLNDEDYNVETELDYSNTSNIVFNLSGNRMYVYGNGVIMLNATSHEFLFAAPIAFLHYPPDVNENNDTVYVPSSAGEVVVLRDSSQKTSDVELTGFIVDAYRERGQCYDVIITLRNNTQTSITRSISLSEQVTYLNNEGQPAPLPTERADRYFDCDTGMALAVNGTINRSLTIPAKSTAQIQLRLRHDWDWIERRTVLTSIYGVLSDRILDALVDMGLKLTNLDLVIQSAQLYENFGKLFYEKHGVRPRALYRYTLQVEGLEERPHRDVQVVVSEFQQGWFRGSFAAAVHANINCLVWYYPWAAPGCALAISTAETLYLAAYGEVALTATSSLTSSYTELVIPQPLTLSMLNQISDPRQRAYVEQHIQVEALQRAALESLRRATAASVAGDSVWALRQRQHAQQLLEQAAGRLGTASHQAATLVAGLTPPTATEIAAYQAALERDGFDTTTRTIFVDVGVTAANQEALRADLLTLAPEDWPELSGIPAALSAYERNLVELARAAMPKIFLPLVRR